eukprot:scaffold115001_cov69-Phaeocystis_antarctica.AAC.4
MRLEAGEEEREAACERGVVRRGEPLLGEGSAQLERHLPRARLDLQRAGARQRGAQRRREHARRGERRALLADEGERGHLAAERGGLRDELHAGRRAERRHRAVEHRVRAGLQRAQRRAARALRDEVERRGELHGRGEPGLPVGGVDRGEQRHLGRRDEVARRRGVRVRRPA